MVSPVHADGLAPTGARTSVGTSSGLGIWRTNKGLNMGVFRWKCPQANITMEATIKDGLPRHMHFTVCFIGTYGAFNIIMFFNGNLVSMCISCVYIFGWNNRFHTWFLVYHVQGRKRLNPLSVASKCWNKSTIISVLSICEPHVLKSQDNAIYTPCKVYLCPIVYVINP